MGPRPQGGMINQEAQGPGAKWATGQRQRGLRREKQQFLALTFSETKYPRKKESGHSSLSQWRLQGFCTEEKLSNFLIKTQSESEHTVPVIQYGPYILKAEIGALTLFTQPVKSLTAMQET